MAWNAGTLPRRTFEPIEPDEPIFPGGDTHAECKYFGSYGSGTAADSGAEGHRRKPADESVTGLKLTIESLEDENARLQEELFKVQAGAVEEKDTAKENQAEAIEAIGEKLAFYYKDMKQLDPKKLTAEDGETLYNILDYTFKALKKAGVKMEK